MLMRYSVQILCSNFQENQFTNNFYNTIGVDFKIKTVKIGQKSVKLQIVIEFL